MKYEFDARGVPVPAVRCCNCHKKMVVDDVDVFGMESIFYMSCSDEQCGGWCRIKNGEVISYGVSKD